MKEEQIRPDVLFEEYLSLAKKDAIVYFQNSAFYHVRCPACGNDACSFVFQKSGFDYKECSRCKTLFVNPRPLPDAFSTYYRDAPSIKYWASHFYKLTEKSRRELLIRPKAKMVRDIIAKSFPDFPNNSVIIDIGSGYGVFCEELQQILGGQPPVIGIEPSNDLYAVCKNKGIISVNKFFEDFSRDDIPGKQIIAATSFELLEHLHDPDIFIKKCSEVLVPGALLILTTLNWHGFDLQVLREKSRSIQPPAHLNFFTPDSVRRLLERHGFTIVEITIPRQRDIDIVSKQAEDVNDSFMKRLLSGNEKTEARFQKFLQDEQLSSHMLIVAKRSE